LESLYHLDIKGGKGLLAPTLAIAIQLHAGELAKRGGHEEKGEPSQVREGE